MREIKFRSFINGKMMDADRTMLEISLRGFQQTENYILMQLAEKVYAPILVLMKLKVKTEMLNIE